MIKYNKSVINWFLQQQMLSSDPVNNCILLHPHPLNNCILCDLMFLFTVHFISIKPELNDHLSYVTTFHCSLGRSH